MSFLTLFTNDSSFPVYRFNHWLIKAGTNYPKMMDVEGILREKVAFSLGNCDNSRENKRKRGTRVSE